MPALYPRLVRRRLLLLLLPGTLVKPERHPLPHRLGRRIGIWFEAALFSLALADHINLLRKEKESALAREQAVLRQAKHDLEEKVNERTHGLELAKQQADEANAAKGPSSPP
ncbi:hypothetical protein [Candidatus Reidiella endopervernicosa]|uniref:Uncharacterized protein n=1 Tax=Candidatus Reidiella endopervernicosa TaxID=2738883 RepID=A0A6N0HYX0_9GAMM|nr:hypothetical protein [Candidatus Reidiella endopervernicosa]QKQ27376.1 hypothetical protein HUE57_14625 [Candidatus Reidiella endopervernicosa]